MQKNAFKFLGPGATNYDRYPGPIGYLLISGYIYIEEK